MRNLALLAVAILAGCSDAGTTPEVTVTEATPDTLAPADDTRDDLTITVDYDDGDGDLGGGIAEVHDCRADGLVTALPIPAIAPENVIGEHITGSLELHVNDVGALAAEALPAACADLGVDTLGDSQTVFCVVLVDAAGNRGTGDCTVPITLE